MAQAVTIAVEPRDPAKNKGTGTRAARRLRAQGRVPAILYGHKQANQPITLARDDVWNMIKKGTHLAQLNLGETTEMALVRDVQWDHLGKEIIHLDFYRVDANERVSTTVPITIHGTAAGLHEGGMLELPVHSLSIECLVTQIPDSIRVDVSELHIGGMIHVRDLNLPEGVKVEDDPDQVVAHVVLRKVEVEPAPVAAEPAQAEPEVIGRKEKKDEEEAEKK
jgi:large subunit ribosomal protein L25